MQNTKTFTSKFFRGEARDQLVKDLKKMAKAGWSVHTISDGGLGKGSRHTGRLTVVYERQE